MSGRTRCSARVRMSAGASAAIRARSRAAPSRAASTRRARSSSAARTRRPLRPGVGVPSGTRAGLAPKKDGVGAMRCPPATSMFTETWWPSTRQPQGAVSEGTPKTVTWYRSGSRGNRRTVPSRLASTDSRAMMVTALAYPRRERPLERRAWASFCWLPSSSGEGEPLPLLGDVVPVVALLALHGEDGAGALVSGEAGEEGGRRFGHPGGGGGFEVDRGVDGGAGGAGLDAGGLVHGHLL